MAGPRAIPREIQSWTYISSASYIARLKFLNLVTLHQEIRESMQSKASQMSTDHNIENAEYFVLGFLDGFTAKMLVKMAVDINMTDPETLGCRTA